jgi:WD40 repeat protein
MVMNRVLRPRPAAIVRKWVPLAAIAGSILIPSCSVRTSAAGQPRGGAANAGATISLANPRENCRIYDLAFYPRPSRLVCAFALDQTVQLWDLSAEPRLNASLAVPRPEGSSRALEREYGRPVAFSSDGARLAVSRYDLGVHVWKVDERELVGRVGPYHWMPEAIQFLAADRGIAVGYSWRGFTNISGRVPSKVRILAGAEHGRRPTGDEKSVDTYKDVLLRGGVEAPPQEREDIYCVAVSRDGRTLFYGGGPVFTDIDPLLWQKRPVTAWDVTAGRRMFTIGGEQVPVLRFCLSLDGGLLYSCGDEVLGWNALKSARPIRKFDASGRRMISVAVSPDGTMLAAGGLDGTLLIWDTDSATRLAALRHGAGPVYRLAFSPASTKLVAAGEGGVATVWDVLLTKTKRK